MKIYRKINDTLISWIYLLYMGSFLLPTIGVITRGRTFLIIIFMIMLLFYFLKSKSKSYVTLQQKSGIFVGYLGLIFFSIQVIFQNMRSMGVGYDNIYTTIFYIFASLFMYQMMKKYYPISLKKSVRYLFLLFSISLFISDIYMVTNYASVKYITGNANIDDIFYIKANLWGLGNSIYYMALSAAYPLILNNLINKKYIANKFFDLIVLLLLPATVILSGSMTAIAMLMLGVLIFFLLNILDFRLKRGIYVVIVFALIFLFTYVFFRVFSDNNFIVWVEDRLTNIMESILDSNMTDESYVYRKSLNRISINSFIDHPIFGIGTHIGALNDRVLSERFGNGNHAAIYDLLAQYGILGAISFVFIYYELLKQSLLNASKVYLKNTIAVFSGIIVILLSAFFNPTVLNGMYFTIVCFFFVLCTYTVNDSN